MPKGYDYSGAKNYANQVNTRLDQLKTNLEADFGDIGLVNVNLKEEADEILKSMKTKIDAEKERVNSMSFK
jgi:hypothetical protein